MCGSLRSCRWLDTIISDRNVSGGSPAVLPLNYYDIEEVSDCNYSSLALTVITSVQLCIGLQVHPANC